MVGSLVVRVMLDYRTLPFISSQSPYLESLRPNRQVVPEGVSGRDIEFIVYGWSRAPIFESGTRVWTLPDPVFQRLVNSRASRPAASATWLCNMAGPEASSSAFSAAMMAG